MTEVRGIDLADGVVRQRGAVDFEERGVSDGAGGPGNPRAEGSPVAE